jgi:hypothetical protein
MKLAAVLLAVVAVTGVAAADPVDPYAPPPRAALRAQLLARFDRNHDGRLEPRERRHAIRALRRLARQLARQERRIERRAARLNGIVQRYDVNGDGVVGPDELPPGMVRRLRPLDRNGDGWVDNADL